MPNQYTHTGITVEGTGRKLYLARRRTGAPWRRIAEEFGIAENAACQYARRFAHRFDYEWPIRKHVKRIRVKTNGKKIYDLACFMGASTGHISFEFLGSLHGVSYEVARKHAHDYAKMYSRPWPVPSLYVPGWGEISYNIRADSNCGRTWVSIQEEVGFQHTTHCIAAARTWAQKNGLSWPLMRTEK